MNEFGYDIDMGRSGVMATDSLLLALAFALTVSCASLQLIFFRMIHTAERYT